MGNVGESDEKKQKRIKKKLETSRNFTKETSINIFHCFPLCI